MRTHPSKRAKATGEISRRITGGTTGRCAGLGRGTGERGQSPKITDFRRRHPLFHEIGNIWKVIVLRARFNVITQKPPMTSQTGGAVSCVRTRPSREAQST